MPSLVNPLLIDPTKPSHGNPRTRDVRDNFSHIQGLFEVVRQELNAKDGLAILVQALIVPANGAVLLALPFTFPWNMPANLAGSDGFSIALATAETTITVNRNGSAVASVVYAAGVSTPAFNTLGGNAVVWAVGDHMTVVSQSPADATWKGSFMLHGTVIT